MKEKVKNLIAFICYTLATAEYIFQVKQVLPTQIYLAV